MTVGKFYPPDIAMDAFLDMLPEKLLAHPDGLLFEAAQADGDITYDLEVNTAAAAAAERARLILDAFELQPNIIFARITRQISRNSQQQST